MVTRSKIPQPSDSSDNKPTTKEETRATDAELTVRGTDDMRAVQRRGLPDANTGFNDAATSLLFEGRTFVQKGGLIDVVKMANTLCPTFFATEEFRNHLAAHLKSSAPANGLTVFETGNDRGRCLVRVVANGEAIRAICVVVDGPLNQRSKSPSSIGSTNQLAALSTREHQVLGHLVNGLSTKQVAAAMFLSPRTIEKTPGSNLQESRHTQPRNPHPDVARIAVRKSIAIRIITMLWRFAGLVVERIHYCIVESVKQH